MQPKLPPELVRLILNYAYLENNINILVALEKLFINYYDYNNAKIIVDKLNKIFANYKLKTHFIIVCFSNDCRVGGRNTDLNDDEFKPRLVIDNGDDITDNVISDLVLHFLLSENAEAAEPIFYPPGDDLEYIQSVNSILKRNNFKSRVIPYNDEFAMQRIFKNCS